MGRHLHEVVEVTKDCEIGSAGERGVVIGLSADHMTILFPDRGTLGRKAHTGADYAFLRRIEDARQTPEAHDTTQRDRLVAQGFSPSVAVWLVPVFAAMQPLEELGGPSHADYIVIMEAIANHARRSADTHRENMSRAEVAEVADDSDDKACQMFTIYLDIDGDADEIAHIIEKVLDAGTLQDAIREYADDSGIVLEVCSAVSK